MGFGELSVGVANHHRAAATAATDADRDLDDVGDDGDAVGARQQAVGNERVALAVQLFEDARGFDEPRFFASAREGGLCDAGRTSGGEQQREQKFFHARFLAGIQ